MTVHKEGNFLMQLDVTYSDLITHLVAARSQLDAPAPALELFAEELRLAHDALAEITGAFTPDDLLGEIFARFCIGK